MDTFELIKKARDGNKEARDQVITENIPLVWSIVKRFSGRGQELQDLFQIGTIGLMKAIDKFDMSFDVKFSTYAVPMITGEIKRFLRDDGMIKVSRSLKETAGKVRIAEEQLNKKLGRDPTIEEISKELQIEVEDIAMAVSANAEVESLYKTIYQGDGSAICLIDKLEETKDEQEAMINHLTLKKVMDSLEEKDRELIKLRYFMDWTQTDIAKEFGISQVQVSRLEKKILKKMREGFV
ncbi:RNA polymerase sporulation sigma factor SigF [Velocimicrobium porci]|uniref:RNA polymerase sigma factor n=1 Tax=Velocimicrobium porci TaxID=2606634 RepID=A0A6L5XYC4_9FIRM|nr:RNA polymerase sporulation sigma factor SigF [Velocimicrobium porci]MSS63517.1 RNA polymerase sporulation sigma factor SigF [Velocimicrobium porci]